MALTMHEEPQPKWDENKEHVIAEYIECFSLGDVQIGSPLPLKQKWYKFSNEAGDTIAYGWMEKDCIIYNCYELSICVDRIHQQKTIGSQVLELLVQEAKKLGAGSVTAVVKKSNRQYYRVIDFFRKNKFTEDIPNSKESDYTLIRYLNS